MLPRSCLGGLLYVDGLLYDAGKRGGCSRGLNASK